MERQFDIQLEKLKTRLNKMCSLVDEQINLALRSIEEENAEFAKTVLEKEPRVDKYDRKIEKICQKIFALNQPVAMDLRLIMSALTISTNLERLGDISVNIAEEYLVLEKKPSFFSRTLFNEMTLTVRDMIKNSFDAFMQNNPELAQRVITSDDKLDELNRENNKSLISIMEEKPEYVKPGVSMINISREMERLGDHATNIAEDVFFIVQAQLIKHNYEKFFFGTSEEDEDQD